MKKILILLAHHDSANGICCDAIIKELIDYGYNVICVVDDNYYDSAYLISDKLKIIKIKMSLTKNIEMYFKNKKTFFSSFMLKLSFILNKLNLILSIPTWPLISPIYTIRYYLKSIKICKEENIDYLISIFTPVDTLIAGHLIKKKIPRIKFICYFLDSFSGGCGPKVFSNRWLIKRGLQWENMLFKNTDKIIIMNSAKGHYTYYYYSTPIYEKISFLDIPLISKPTEEYIIDSNILDDTKINLVFVGSIPYHIRNPEFILEVFSRINIDNCVFTIIGTNTCPQLLKKFQDLLGNNKVVLIDKIPHETAIGVLKKADFLVNIGNNISSMVPSKIFEYMSMGKPIISTYPIHNEPSLTYLNKYPLALTLKEDFDNFSQSTLLLEDFIKSKKDITINFNDIQQSFPLNCPKTFINQIENI